LDESIVDNDSRIDAEMQDLRPVIELLRRVGAPFADAGARAVGPELEGSLGDFRIVRVVGRGGMGVVYEAIQESLQRRVALKVLPPAFADDPRRVRRFQVEAQAAAGLLHPHIVPVYLVGSARGLHYYAMQFIAGHTLADLIAISACGDDPVRDLSFWRIAAELGGQAALALHFAHEQGVIHRDVKPSNLLIDDSGWLWVGDFGLARIVGQADSTLSGGVLGTLRYMSPEQAGGGRVVVDHRCDVYSLGATLYELVTGRPAFDDDDCVDLVRRIAAEDPEHPRRIDPNIPRDLETIVLKAMAKEPGERYATALELAEDLDRFDRGRPILGRSPGAVDRAAKWARRNRSAAAAALILPVALAAGLSVAMIWRDGVLSRHNAELKAALALAERNEASSRQLLYDSQVRLAQQARGTGQRALARQILDGLQPGPGQRDRRGFEWYYLRQACDDDAVTLATHEPLATAIAASPDRLALVTGHAGGTMVFFDCATRRERGRLRAHPSDVAGIVFSQDGRTLASWSKIQNGPSEVKLWDPSTARQIARIPGIEGHVTELAFSRDGKRLHVLEHDRAEVASRNRLITWDLSRGAEHPAQGAVLVPCSRMASSGDGRWLVTSATSGAVTLRDGATGEAKATLPGPFSWIAELACSPDGEIVALDDGQNLAFWDPATARKLGSLPVRLYGPPKFSPDGNCVAGRTDSRQGIVLIKDVRTQRRRILLEKAQGGEVVFAFSPDGSRLAGGGTGLSATVWETNSGRKLAELSDVTGRVGSLTFTVGGESLVAPVENGPIYAWRLDRPTEPAIRLDGHDGKEIWSLAFTHDGSALMSAGDDHRIKLWDPLASVLRAMLEGHDQLVAAVAISPDGGLLASASFDRTVRLWSLPSGRPCRVLRGHTDRVRAVAFSPDGRRVASAGSDGDVRIWETERAELAQTFRGPGDAIRALAFDPSGKLLFWAGDDVAIRALDLSQGREVFTLAGTHPHSALAFSPDGMLLASADDGGTVTIWDLAARSRRGTAKATGAEVWGLAFSPDGRTLAAACGDARIRLWDPLTGQLLLVLEGHTRRVNAVAFSADGRSLASGCHDGELRIWRAETPRGGAQAPALSRRP
jgi:WD40 repeat protein